MSEVMEKMGIIKMNETQRHIRTQRKCKQLDHVFTNIKLKTRVVKVNKQLSDHEIVL